MKIQDILASQVETNEYLGEVRKFIRTTNGMQVPGLPAERSRRLNTALAIAIANELTVVSMDSVEAIAYFNGNFAAPLSVFASTMREYTLFDIERFVDAVRSFWGMRVSAAYPGIRHRQSAGKISDYFTDTNANLNGDLQKVLADPEECSLITGLASNLTFYLR